MSNTFQEDLGQLIERHRSEFKEPCNPYEMARVVVEFLGGDMKEDQ